MRATTILLSSLLLLGISGQAEAGRRGKAQTTEVQPTGEHMSEAQKGNVQALTMTLEMLKGESQVTDGQKEQLKKDLMNVADGANKPSEETVAALTASLTEALADESLTPMEAKQVASDLSKVLNSAGISQEEAMAAAESAKAVLEASGVSKEDAMKVAESLKAITAELQKNVAAGAEKVEQAAPEATRSRRR